MTALLSVRGLSKRFGGVVATDCLDFDLAPGELHAIIGPNGAGKTTLINLFSGEFKPDAGSIRYDGAEIGHLTQNRRAAIGLVRSYQITSVFPEFTALQNVMFAVQARSGNNLSLLRDVDHDASLTMPARDALAQVGLAELQHVSAASLAHGGRRQLEIAMVLALRPKVMLLDEPLAGMSGHEADVMVQLLRCLKGRFGIVLVEHDIEAVFALADKITVVVAGRPVATGTPAEIHGDAEVRRVYLGDEDDQL